MYSAQQLHLVLPSSELSERNGSAILRVASELSAAAERRGTVTTIGCGINKLRDPHLGVAMITPPPTWTKTIPGVFLDALWKLVAGHTAFAPKYDATKLSGVTDVFVHNQPWLGNHVRRAFPHARIHLYVHNRVMTKARPWAIRNRLGEFDSVVCVSQFLLNDLYRRSRIKNPVERTNLKLVQNGIDVDKFRSLSSDKNEFDIVYVGRIVREKGVHVLADAVRKIASTRPVSIRLVGGKGFLPTDSVSKYEQKVISALTGPNIRLDVTGPVPPGEVPHLVNGCRTWVVPSIWQEPFGLVLLEAMASHTAPIATRVGGMTEVGTSSGVTFVEPSDSQELADAILGLLDDSARADTSVISSRLKAEQHTWAHAYGELEKVINWSSRL
ncbi:glycosyltransferase family 4 protein [Arthrobacter sp. ZGTC212]|uniref:glycosyltransferase family 4 protein n=1 Tax=Arthrobacter sp. ZGTC212 TaxID=2058899 RepID=UPI000CE516D2|nr:glycosyltransferase family 4 protein [Arthrobacter sp. ZGTC212]